jgi:predicted  nucleic acid-binding Zn-ribbon protein
VAEKIDLKELKDLPKTMKTAENKENKLKLDLTDLAKNTEKLLAKTDLKSSKTEQHTEIPYK